MDDIGSITVTETTATLGNYRIKFTIKDSTGESELSSVALKLTAWDSYESSGTKYKLVTAAYVASTGQSRKQDATSSEIKGFTIAAAWDTTGGYSAPTGEDAAWLLNKNITGAALTATGNVKLMAGSTLSGLTSSPTEYASATFTVHVDDESVNTLTITSMQNSVNNFRVATNNPDGPEYYDATDFASGNKFGQTAPTNLTDDVEYHHNDGLAVTVASSLSVG